MNVENEVNKILIIDDDPMIRDLFYLYLKESNAVIRTTDSLSEGIDMAVSEDFDLVFLDVNLPDGSGLEAIDAFKGVPSGPEVIIITGEGDTEGAKMAMDSGAWDYLLKPLSRHDVVLQVKRALEYRASKKALKSSKNIFNRSKIIGSNPKLMARLNTVAQCAGTNANVLITGATGTGKELFANLIHANSRQKENPFVVVDCAALPEQLVESLLFGHVKGAFTGADANREGLVKKADGGTLFLDEVGELSLSIQKKLLRILQERKFRPVGSTQEVESNFRLISATNRDLEQMVENRRFRNDLLFRLKTIQLDLPALRDCKEDIKDLTLHYIYELCNHHGLETKGFVPEFLEYLENYHWPGNTRELISSLEKAILADPESPTLYPNYLPNPIRLQYLKNTLNEKPNAPPLQKDAQPSNVLKSIDLPDHFFKPIKPLKQVKNYIIGETEKIYLENLLRLSEGDLNKASDLSCLSKGRLYDLLKKYDMGK